MIKKLFAILLLISVTGLFAQDAQQYFVQANQLYQQGKFEQALEVYNKILNEGYESGELHFNIGNAYYRLGKIGKSRLSYERAQKFLKGDEALEQNLKLVQARLVDQIENPPRLFLAVWWDALLNLFNISLLTIIVSGLFWMTIMIGGLRLYYRFRGRYGRLKGVFAVVLTVFLLFSFIMINKIYIFETEKYGIILNPSVTLYAEPSNTGTELFVVHEGTKVRIERKNQMWFEVKLADGKTGWVQRENFEII
ncbi:MAG: SH3 domain-containing protein [Calditrichaceae bacterium]